MKTMIVVSELRMEKHVGEEYDGILTVVHEPTTANIQDYALSVMNMIRELWQQDVGMNDPRVVVYLDAAVPFAAMLVNLQIILRDQEGIMIDLPWEKSPNVEELDAESRDILRKLEQGK